MVATLHVTPAGAGTRNGQTLTNAARLTDVPALLGTLDAGGEVRVYNHLGVHQLPAGTSLVIDRGGTTAQPFTMRGCNASGVSGVATVRHDRTPDPRTDKTVRTDVTTWAGFTHGSLGFRLSAGSDHWKFKFLRFENFGNGCFYYQSSVTNHVIEDCQADNVRRFIELAASVSPSYVTVRRCIATGYSRHFVTLRNTAHHWTFEDCTADSQRQDGDPFACGFVVYNACYTLRFYRCTARNHHQQRASGDYWNADGFEVDNDSETVAPYDIYYESCVSEGNTDGGWDVKARVPGQRSIFFKDCVARDNKRNFRFWHREKVILVNCRSENPKKRGGSGGASHFHSSGAVADLYNPVVVDTGANGTQAIFHLEYNNSQFVTYGLNRTAAAAGVATSVVETGSSLSQQAATANVPKFDTGTPTPPPPPPPPPPAGGTRFYLPSSGTAGLSPAPSAGWGVLPDPVPYLPTNPGKTGTSQVEFTTTKTGTVAVNGLVGVWVSEPLAAQTITGTIKAVARCRQSAADADMAAQMVVRVVTSAAAERGVLLPADNGPVVEEWSYTDWYGRWLPRGGTPAAVTPVVAQEGDRLVFEIGFRSYSTLAGGVGKMWFGDAATADLPYAFGGVDAVNPWVELSHDLVFSTATPPPPPVPLRSGGGMGAQELRRTLDARFDSRSGAQLALATQLPDKATGVWTELAGSGYARSAAAAAGFWSPATVDGAGTASKIPAANITFAAVPAGTQWAAAGDPNARALVLTDGSGEALQAWTFADDRGAPTSHPMTGGVQLVFDRTKVQITAVSDIPPPA